MPTMPFGMNLYPIKGAPSPDVAIIAGNFTTDAFGNVLTTSGLYPGMAVSGTNIASGVYTVYIGNGPALSGPQQASPTTAGFGSGVTQPLVSQSFGSILWLSAQVVGSGQNSSSYFPTARNEDFYTTYLDPVAASGQFMHLQNTASVLGGVGVPSPFTLGQAQIMALIQVSRKVT